MVRSSAANILRNDASHQRTERLGVVKGSTIRFFNFFWRYDRSLRVCMCSI